MAKKPDISRKGAARLDLLDKEERAALTDQARKSLIEEMTQDARDQYFAAELKRLRQEQIPDEMVEPLLIDVASYVPFLMIDGVQFFHGYTYQVTRGLRAVLMEQMQRSWEHQDELDGRSRTEAYRKPMNVVLGPQHAGVPTVGANGAVAGTAAVFPEG